MPRQAKHDDVRHVLQDAVLPIIKLRDGHAEMHGLVLDSLVLAVLEVQVRLQDWFLFLHNAVDEHAVRFEPEKTEEDFPHVIVRHGALLAEETE